jgi:hypothetical protein
MESAFDEPIDGRVGRRHAVGMMAAAAASMAFAPGDAPSNVLRVGVYACLRVTPQQRARAAAAGVPAVVEQLGLVNEFHARDGHPDKAVAFLRRVGATRAQIDDPALFDADVVVHAAAASEATASAFMTGLADVLRDAASIRFLRGVVRPTQYTGNAMHEFAYARQVVQQPGERMPHAFLVPMNKTPAWWEKSWMERHTYFLPRYGDTGRMVHEGHALAASAGIASLMRRTYKSDSQPAADGQYEFVNYFECADEGVPTFEAVVGALRDLQRNPEWSFVREGPTWRGRRVPGWTDLFS